MTSDASELARPRPVAPMWHTVVVLAFVCVPSLFVLFGKIPGNGAWLTGVGVPSAMVREVRYVMSVLVQWLMIVFIAFGVRRHGGTMRELIGGRWPTAGAVVRDVAVAVAFLVASWIILGTLGAALGVSAWSKGITVLLPRTPLERATWCVVAATAGFCEEVIFRGYLMRQLGAWTGNRAIAVVLQGGLFGLGHAYQGHAYVILVAVFGTMLGALASRRRSLRPGIVAHGLQDLFAGLAGSVLRH